MPTPTDHEQIQAACEAFGEGLRAMDVAALEELWDRDFDHLVYQPEEYPKACRSWKEIVDYWTYIPTAVNSIDEWRILDLDVAVVGDAAIVYLVAATVFDLKELDEPFAGDVRFTLGLRRTADGWRFIHAHESRLLEVDGDH